MTKRVHIAGILFATIFGFSFMFSKVVLDSLFVSPIGLIAYRFLVAFLAFEILRRFKVIHIRFDRSTFKYFFWVAFFQPILYFLFETFGLAKTTSGEAGMMIALIPIFVTLLSSFILKERPNIVQIGFIILSVTGVVFIQVMKSNEGLSYNVVGFLLLLGAVLSAAMFNIASRKASLVLSPVEVTYFMMMLGALAFNIIYVIQLTIQGNLIGYFTNAMHLTVILPILYLGLVASIFGFALVNYALSKAPAHITSIYANLSTLVAVAAGAILLGERLEYYHLIGSLMIVSGVYGTVRFRKDQLMLIRKRKELKQ
jgi:drug/metabolite transporter (DMT)-like permease